MRRGAARVAALHSVFYLLLTVPVEVGLGLAAAWMTLRVTRGQGLLAAIFLIPDWLSPGPWPGTLFDGLFNIHGVADQVSQDLFGGGSSFLWLTPRRRRSASLSCSASGRGPVVLPLAVGRTEHLSGGGLRGGEDRRCPRVRPFGGEWSCPPSVRRRFRLGCAPSAGRGTDLQLGSHAHQWRAELPGATELVGFDANVLAFGYDNFGEASAMGNKMQLSQ